MNHTCTVVGGASGIVLGAAVLALAATALASPQTDASATGPATHAGALAEPNEPPTLEIPAYERIGVGQEIGFGIEVIDLESDDFRVELIGKPASASYDPYTLTVVWTPTPADIPLGSFRVRIVETLRESGRERVFEHDFSIDVTPEPQPLPKAQPLGPAVETLITIHDTERLAVVNERWPIDKMLMVNADRKWETLSDEQKKKVGKPDPAILYASFLKSLSLANANPDVDPDSDTFDRAGFGSPPDWKIIAVRPRLDKKWHEVRIVYRAKAHAATYAMFKMRPVGVAPAAEGRPYNNRVMQKLTLEHFFIEGGVLDPENMRDKQRHAKRVADFLDAVIAFESDDHPWSKPGIEALPCESRLGGGSTRGSDGTYESGDGWAWNAMKPAVQGDRIVYANVPLKGFLSDVKPSADGSSWELACGGRFDASSDAHAPGYEVLCRSSGHTDLPGSGDGYADAEKTGEPVVSSRVDAANRFVEHKRAHTVGSVALRDPRRDLFEEKGMTCHQCHVRKFGVRDMYDRTAYDPRAGVPSAANKKQDTTYFVIVPTTHWQPYAIDFQHKQVCKFKAAFRELSNVETDLVCPLMAE